MTKIKKPQLTQMHHLMLLMLLFPESKSMGNENLCHMLQEHLHLQEQNAVTVKLRQNILHSLGHVRDRVITPWENRSLVIPIISL